MIINMYRISFWGDGSVLELVVMILQPCEYNKNH